MYIKLPKDTEAEVHKILKFCNFHWKNTSVWVSFSESPAFTPATLLKRDSNTSVFLGKLLLFKISNSNNVLKDFSAISLMHNKSLITCNSLNDKQIWKCSHFPNTCFNRAFQHYQLCRSFALLNSFFRLECYLLYETTKVFLALAKKLFTISITSVSFNIDWLTSFWRYVTLIGSFELDINIT